jgi:hypothetical protein
MRIVYTYHGERDPDYEDVITGQICDSLQGQARQVAAEPTSEGDVVVTLETELDRLDWDRLDRELVSDLRTNERLRDLTAGETRLI